MRFHPSRHFIAPMLALALLACAPLAATEGMADYLARLGDARTMDSNVSIDEWRTQRDRIAAAVRLDPRSAALHEALGVLHANHVAQRRIGDDIAELFRAQALEHLRAAISERPASPYTWASYAHVKARMGMADREFLAALLRAMELGAWEPEVQLMAADLGLQLWAILPLGAQRSVEANLRRASLRQGARLMEIGAARGALERVCGAAVRPLSHPKLACPRRPA